MVLGLALFDSALLAARSAAQPPPAAASPALTEFTGGGVTIKLGTPKADIMAQMAKHPEGEWFVQDLDSRPTDELLKMDKWTLAYSNGASGGGVITLIFVSDKVSKILKGAQ